MLASVHALSSTDCTHCPAVIYGWVVVGGPSIGGCDKMQELSLLLPAGSSL